MVMNIIYIICSISNVGVPEIAVINGFVLFLGSRGLKYYRLNLEFMSGVGY